MYQFAYAAICEEPSTPLPRCSQNLLVAMELIEAASEARQPIHFVQLLSEFRRLWLAIVEELSREEPDAALIGASTLSMANSVLREIEFHRFQGVCDLAQNAETFA